MFVAAYYNLVPGQLLHTQAGQCTRNYMLAMLAALDDSVGRVVTAWKAAGLYANSVIVFQSDKYVHSCRRHEQKQMVILECQQ